MFWCPVTRPISEDEIKHLKDHRYAALSDHQILIDQKLQVEVKTQPLFVRSTATVGVFMFLEPIFPDFDFYIFDLQHCFFCYGNFLCFISLCTLFFYLFLLQLEAQEEKLRLEEEARNAAQREAARLARERKMKEVRWRRALPSASSDLLLALNTSSS